MPRTLLSLSSRRGTQEARTQCLLLSSLSRPAHLWQSSLTVTGPSEKLFEPAFMQTGAGSTLFSPTTQPGDAEISYRHCTHTAGCCAKPHHRDKFGAPLLMDCRTNLDLRNTGKNSLFLPITEDKDVHGKRRPQHKRPDGKNCDWKLGKEVPLTGTALYRCYLSRFPNFWSRWWFRKIKKQLIML